MKTKLDKIPEQFSKPVEGMPDGGEQHQALLPHKPGEPCQVLGLQAVLGDVQDAVGPEVEAQDGGEGGQADVAAVVAAAAAVALALSYASFEPQQYLLPRAAAGLSAHDFCSLNMEIFLGGQLCFTFGFSQ